MRCLETYYATNAQLVGATAGRRIRFCTQVRLRNSIALASTGSTLAPTTAAATTTSSNIALDWNEITVTAVRAARTTDGVPSGESARPLYQTEGLLHTAYVEAAVYDAMMKISRRYQPYHDFEAAAADASLEAAVIASSLQHACLLSRRSIRHAGYVVRKCNSRAAR